MRQFYDQQIKVKRLKGSGNIRSLVATATGEAHLQPLSKESGALDAGVYGQTFQAYVDADLPATKGDYITDRDGNVYVVSDAVLRDMGAFPYKELIVKRTQPIT